MDKKTWLLYKRGTIRNTVSSVMLVLKMGKCSSVVNKSIREQFGHNADFAFAYVWIHPWETLGKCKKPHPSEMSYVRLCKIHTPNIFQPPAFSECGMSHPQRLSIWCWNFLSDFRKPSFHHFIVAHSCILCNIHLFKQTPGLSQSDTLHSLYYICIS